MTLSNVLANGAMGGASMGRGGSSANTYARTHSRQVSGRRPAEVAINNAGKYTETGNRGQIAPQTQHELTDWWPGH